MSVPAGLLCLFSGLYISPSLSARLIFLPAVAGAVVTNGWYITFTSLLAIVLTLDLNCFVECAAFLLFLCPHSAVEMPGMCYIVKNCSAM